MEGKYPPREYDIFNPNDDNDDSFLVGKAASGVIYAIFMIVLLTNIL